MSGALWLFHQGHSLLFQFLRKLYNAPPWVAAIQLV
jgi:hypothetical protein